MDTWRSPHGRELPSIGGRTLVMGILNVTPDSFSDGGELRDAHAVVERAAGMLAAGADVLDIGGESTRPGAHPIGEGEELARVLPALRAVRQRWPEVPLSIDTFKPRVAEAAIHAGADIINDVWGLTHGLAAETRAKAIAMLASAGVGRGLPTPPNPDGAERRGRPFRQAQGPEPVEGETPPYLNPVLPPSPMAAAAARMKAPVVLMHNRPDRNYRDFWPDLLADLKLSVVLAEQAGVLRHQIWLDPGFGFAKEPAHNLEVLKHLDRVVALGFPVLVGTSRKSTIGKVLDTTVNDRLEGSGATAVWAIAQGAAMIRVHDVPEMKRFALMADAIKAGIGYRLP